MFQQMFEHSVLSNYIGHDARAVLGEVADVLLLVVRVLG